jgi:hypothetical protein
MDAHDGVGYKITTLLYSLERKSTQVFNNERGTHDTQVMAIFRIAIIKTKTKHKKRKKDANKEHLDIADIARYLSMLPSTEIILTLNSSNIHYPITRTN